MVIVPSQGLKVALIRGGIRDEERDREIYIYRKGKVIEKKGIVLHIERERKSNIYRNGKVKVYI